MLRSWYLFFLIFPDLLISTDGSLTQGDEDMDVKEADLCTFCSDLVTAPLEESNFPSQRPHHPTYGLLSASSSTCTLCRLIRSLSPHFASDLQRRGVTRETLEICQDGFAVRINVTAARRMPSGISWKLVEACLVSGITPVSFCDLFTLVTCSAGGEPSPTTKVRCLRSMLLLD